MKKDAWSRDIGREIKKSKRLTAIELRRNKIERFYQDMKCLGIEKIFNKDKSGLATLFQRLVRLANSDANGICVCISCGVRKPWNEMQGGHYIPRTNKATIILADNVWPQCTNCNNFLNGNLVAYRIELIKKVGLRRVKQLEAMKLPKNHVWNRMELAEIKVDLLAEIRLHEKRLGIS